MKPNMIRLTIQNIRRNCFKGMPWELKKIRLLEATPVYGIVFQIHI